MDLNETSPKDNFKNAICYIPLLAIVLYFIEDIKTDIYKKNIRYWIYFFALYVVSSVIIKFFLFYWSILVIFFVVYLFISSYFWFRAYKWDEINLYFIDELDKKINALGK